MSYLDKLQYSVDWLNGTLVYYDVRYFFKELYKIHPELTFNNFHSRNRGIYNYSTSFALFGDSRFIVGFNPNYEDYEPSFSDNVDVFPLYARSDGFNPGIFISISGDGLRYLNSLGSNVVSDLFAFFRKNYFKASRLDLACDIFDKDNPIVPLLVEAFYFAINKKAGKATLVSNIRRTPQSISIRLNADPFRDDNEWSHSISFGNHGSCWGMFRLYDKWLEIKTGRLSNMADELLKDKNYWYRLEYELHKEHANKLFYAMSELSISQSFGEAAEDMFKVVVPKSEKTQSDKCADSLVWCEFVEYLCKTEYFVQLGEAEQLVSTPYIENSVNRKKNWVLTQAKSFFAVFSLFEADPAFKNEALNIGRTRYLEDERYVSYQRELDNLNERSFVNA